jgi:hypothetical protein
VSPWYSGIRLGKSAARYRSGSANHVCLPEDNQRDDDDDNDDAANDNHIDKCCRWATLKAEGHPHLPLFGERHAAPLRRGLRPPGKIKRSGNLAMLSMSSTDQGDGKRRSGAVTEAKSLPQYGTFRLALTYPLRL